MPPETRTRARDISLQALPATIDKKGRIIAAGSGRFQNPFTRDFCIAIIQSLSQPGNQEIADLLIPPAIVTLDTIQSHQTTFDMLKGRMPGYVPHEIHDEFTPQERLEELRSLGWAVDLNAQGRAQIVAYEADDANALVVSAVEAVVQASSVTWGEEKANNLLERWWPFVENALLYDLFYGDLGNSGLIQSRQRPGSQLSNRTWRDSADAFIDREGNLPSFPITYFANASFHIQAIEAGERLSQRKGLDGFAEGLRKRAQKGKEILHERFWMEGEQCFAPALDGEGKKVEVVTNESAIGLFAGVVDQDYARKVAKRMLADDLLTPYGTRTRSSDDPQFRVNGADAYHRGTVWTHGNTLLTLGCEKYGLFKEADRFGSAASKLVIEDGCIELTAVDRNGQKEPYLERGEAVACKPQVWAVHGILGITAPMVSQGIRV